MDENSKLFNSIQESDAVESGFIVPGYRNITWSFWWFSYNKTGIDIIKTRVPLYRQMLEGKIKALQSRATEIYNTGVFDDSGQIYSPFDETTSLSHSFANKDDAKEYRSLNLQIEKLKRKLEAVPEHTVEPIVKLYIK